MQFMLDELEFWNVYSHVFLMDEMNSIQSLTERYIHGER